MSWAHGAGIARYRPPRARTAVAYSTKDRVELTQRTALPLLGAPDIDLYWFDGSATEAGRSLPPALCADSPAICEVHYGVTGGPDYAIVHALATLRPYGYDLVILVENDVLLAQGWQEALMACIERASAAGFRVGAASVRVIDRRVLSFNDDYCLLLNAGAGCIALRPAAVDIVLDIYRTTDGEELIRHFRALTGIDVAPTVQFPLGQMCSADCLYELLLYWQGYVVAAPPISFAEDIAPGDGPLQRGAVVVSHPDQHLAALRGVVTTPARIRRPALPFSRFQGSRFSSRLLIGCHQLDMAVGFDTPAVAVRLEGSWRRAWVRLLGPFGMIGTGRIRLRVHAATIGVVLYAGSTPVQLQLVGESGCRATSTMEPKTVVEYALEEFRFGMQDAVVSVMSGEVTFVGVTADPGMVPHYANQRWALEHLLA